MSLGLTGCAGWLDLEPRDKISGEKLFQDPEGVKAYMANIYARLPIEDFTVGIQGFNINGYAWDSWFAQMVGDECCHNDPWWFDSWTFGWNDYKLIRDILVFQETIPNLDVTEQERNTLYGETAFTLAYCYFAMTKRLGGMPILRKPLEYDPDRNAMLRQRDTEKACWDYVMEQCDIAIEKLPETINGETGRANKYVAMALKSRAALYVASYCENFQKVSFSGEAIEKEIVGMKAEYAPEYYRQCIEASEMLMNSGKFGLYKPNPANPSQAAANYQHLFETPADALSESPTEVIWMKWYDEPGGQGKAHNWDIWLNPNQTRGNWAYGGFMSPVLELVDLYEEYSPDGVRESAPIRTRNVADPIAEDINRYGTYAAPCGFDASADYIHYASPLDAFANKDARLQASVMLPMSTWKDTKIIIQGGVIAPDGTPIIKQFGSAVGLDGKVYSSYGSDDPNQYSGYDKSHMGSVGGFLMKKFMQEAENVPAQNNRGTNDWMEFRYAEILLNYAEAVVQYNGATAEQKTLAAQALNDIRHRAAHTDNIPLTFDNVMAERRVELAFENKRFWDIIRLRDFNRFVNYYRKDLVPVLDLRCDPPQYILLRADIESVARSFRNTWYYRELWYPLENGLIPQPTA